MDFSFFLFDKLFGEIELKYRGARQATVDDGDDAVELRITAINRLSENGINGRLVIEATSLKCSSR